MYEYLYIYSFNDHLNIMFEQSPDWDTNKQYTIDNLQVFMSL
jgi:hypothetical protein